MSKPPTEKKALECPYCQETEPENLPTFHYPGLKGSTHIECQTCGSEFTKQEGEQVAETSQAIQLILKL